MIIQIDNDIAILCIINIFSFSLGYILGMLKPISGVTKDSQIGSKDFSINKNIEIINKPKISIDDTKFVTDIKTDGLEKKYQSLGDMKISEENIGSSVSKLKNLKG